jgi:predicted GH43/DUF377 family glycosyl hydrolase
MKTNSSFSPLFIIIVIALIISGLVPLIFAQTQWTKDTRNPILSGGASGSWNRHVFNPRVLFNADSLRYEMWFGGSEGTPWHPCKIGFAVSDDGISWSVLATAVLSPSVRLWDESTVLNQSVIWDNGEYKMWYMAWGSDVIGKTGYATSPDGISWTKHPNPVMEPGSAEWESGSVGVGTVLLVDGGYKMWYVAADNTVIAATNTNIGYATSTDGITWQRDTLNNPVLTTGAPGQWDDAFLKTPNVIIIDSTHYMFYTGSRNNVGKEIGLATSSDGIHWTKYNDPSTTSTLYADSDPVLKPSGSGWDTDYVQGGSILLDGDTLYMWYNGSKDPTLTYLWRIGHATSPLDLVAIADYLDATPSAFTLHQNYPNPFNPVCTIRYDLPQACEVSLMVYDILGREMARLVDGYMELGYHQVQWDGREASGREVPSGIYIARLVTPEYSKSIKMLLLK